MNLGIYVPSLSDHGFLQEADTCISEGLKSKVLSDASIFYDNVAYQPFNFSCGIFNSTELWNFSGTLLTTSLSTCITASKIVNKIKILYYYGLEQYVQPLPLIFLQKGNVGFIARSEDAASDLYRKTGQKPLHTIHNLKDLITKLG